MWRKIHSNRDPRDTLFSELKKEIGPHFSKIGKLGKQILVSNPKCFFWAMVLSMLASLAFAFTGGRHRKPVQQKKLIPAVSPVGEGFSQIMLAAGKIKKTLHLKYLVDSISAKKILSSADSLALDSALNALQQLKTNK